MKIGNKDYIDSINLDMKSYNDVEHLLTEYEEGRISKQEYLALTLLSHSRSHSKGFTSGFERRSKPVQDITSLIETANFQNRLKAAIECGVDQDWCWNGEDEYRVDIFNADEATKYVTELLKECLL